MIFISIKLQRQSSALLAVHVIKRWDSCLCGTTPHFMAENHFGDVLHLHEWVFAPLLSSKSLFFAMVASPISFSLCWMYVCHDNQMPIARETRVSEAIKWLGRNRVFTAVSDVQFFAPAWREAIRVKRPTGKIEGSSEYDECVNWHTCRSVMYHRHSEGQEGLVQRY